MGSAGWAARPEWARRLGPNGLGGSKLAGYGPNGLGAGPNGLARGPNGLGPNGLGFLFSPSQAKFFEVE